MAARSLPQWLQRIEALHPSEIELGLERAAAVYARLSSGSQPRVITVAGTNGKGSTVECLTRCAQAVGQKVGAYTSPHLVRFNERISLNGEPASDAQIVAAFEMVEAARGTIPLTYFEYSTLAALALFRQADLDLWVLEVGLGGRLDAVNIIDAQIAVVTAIGLDHQDWLGGDREVIGREKAGIMRSNGIAICSDPNPPASVASYANSLGAKLYQLGVEFSFEVNEGRWDLQCNDAGKPFTLTGMPKPAGIFLDNVAGALMALATVGLLPDREVLEQVLASVSVRGRLQRIELDVPWWLDVAHNAESARLLRLTLVKAIAAEELTDCTIVLGMLRDKPVDDVLRSLADVATDWILVRLDSPRAIAPGELAKKVQQVSSARVEVLQSVAAGLALARARVTERGCVVVTGSFHTVGPALAWLNR